MADSGAVAPFENFHLTALATAQIAPHRITFTKPEILFKWQLRKALAI